LPGVKFVELKQKTSGSGVIFYLKMLVFKQKMLRKLRFLVKNGKVWTLLLKKWIILMKGHNGGNFRNLDQVLG
jgi:hypothetical protein